jgi:hypothetical protein
VDMYHMHIHVTVCHPPDETISRDRQDVSSSSCQHAALIKPDLIHTQ